MKKIFPPEVILWLTLALSAFGAPLTYNGYPTGFNDGNVYVGNASGTLSGIGIEMWCIDPDHHISANAWEVDVVNLGNPGTALDGLLGLSVNDFRAMFLLGGMFTDTNQATDVSIQHTIWSFANPGGFPLTPTETALKNNMLAAVGNYDFSNAYVLIPQGSHTNWTGQIFETGRADQVPETATVWLVLGAFLIIFTWVRSDKEEK